MKATAPSRLGHYPKQHLIRKLVFHYKELLDVTKAERLPIWQLHNAYTDYCLNLLFLSTGHRPVIDPFTSLEKIDTTNHLLLINDKVMNEFREYRLVALSETAAKQIIEYQSYLTKLVGRLMAEGADRQLVDDVGALAFNQNPTMPLFFNLKPDLKNWFSVTPTTLKTTWSQYWTLPVNYSRHVMADELWHRGREAQWVRIQLGHFEGINHPFGLYSVGSPIKELSSIREILDKVITDLGWISLPSPIRLRSGDPRVTERKFISKRSTKLGPEHRREKRQQHKKRLSEIVREAINSVKENKELNEITPEQYDQIVDRIKEKSFETNLSANIGLRLFYRYISRIGRGEQRLRKIPHKRVIEIEPSPFNSKSLFQYKQFQFARQNFNNYLDHKGRLAEVFSAEDRVAEIIISAILFGGIINFPRVLALKENILAKTFQLEGRLFTDIPFTQDEGPPVFRWFPDPLSSDLILGMFREKVNQESINKRAVTNAIKKISKLIHFNRDPLNSLCELAVTAATFELPGYVKQVLSGDISATSIPLPQYVRLLSGKSLAVDHEKKSRDESSKQKGGWAPEFVHQTKYFDEGEFKRLKIILLQYLKEANNVPPSTNKNVDTRKRKKLCEIIHTNFSDTGPWSELALLVAGWAFDLSKNGTARKKELAYNTVRKYVPMILKSVMRVFGQVDFLGLEEGEYEDVYITSLNSVPRHEQYELVGRLREFHGYLVRNWSVNEPEWSVIYAASGNIKSENFPDANLISVKEYTQLIDRVLSHPELEQRQRVQYAFLVLLGYRFGLRFGEAWQLQYRDIQFDKNLENITLRIRKNFYHSLKTEASVRVIPLIAILSEAEKKLLNQIINFVEPYYADDHLIPVMGIHPGSREIIDRNKSVRIIHKILRDMTGDESLRYHHLRHTFTSFLNKQIPICKSACRDIDLHDDIFGAVEPNALARIFESVPLRALSNCLGHVEASTTLGSYVHNIDELLVFCRIENSPRFSDHVKAYALMINESAVRRRRSREANEESHNQSVKKEIKRLIPSPQVKVVSYNDTHVKLENEQVKLSLVDKEIIISTYAKIHNPDIIQIAEQYLTSVDHIELIISNAVKIEKESGYLNYALENEIFVDDVSNKSKIEPKNNKAEIKRTHYFLNDFEQQLLTFSEAALNDFHNAMKIWMRTFHPKSLSNILSSVDDAKQFINAINKLDPKITLIIKVKDEYQKLVLQLKEIPSVNIEIVKDLPLAMEKSRLRKNNRFQLDMFVKNSSIQTKKTLHRIIYILSCAF